MTPSNLSIMLGISILLWLPPATVAADEPATPADLAELASREQRLRAQVDDRLRASVVAVTEDDGQALAVRMTELLRQQALRVARQDDSPPPAKRALTTHSSACCETPPLSSSSSSRNPAGETSPSSSQLTLSVVSTRSGSPTLFLVYLLPGYPVRILGEFRELGQERLEELRATEHVRWDLQAGVQDFGHPCA